MVDEDWKDNIESFATIFKAGMKYYPEDLDSYSERSATAKQLVR